MSRSAMLVTHQNEVLTLNTRDGGVMVLPELPTHQLYGYKHTAIQALKEQTNAEILAHPKYWLHYHRLDGEPVYVYRCRIANMAEVSKQSNVVIVPWTQLILQSSDAPYFDLMYDKWRQ